MKKAQRIIISVIAFILVISMAACSKSADGDFDMIGDAGMNNAPGYPNYDGNKVTNEYGEGSFAPSVDADEGGALEGEINKEPDDTPAEDSGNKDEVVDKNIYENPFIKVENMDTSTFSADVEGRLTSRRQTEIQHQVSVK